MEKLGMSKLKEILRLRHECNLSARQISRALSIILFASAFSSRILLYFESSVA